jgi:hypothetical protein
VTSRQGMITPPWHLILPLGSVFVQFSDLHFLQNLWDRLLFAICVISKRCWGCTLHISQRFQIYITIVLVTNIYYAHLLTKRVLQKRWSSVLANDDFKPQSHRIARFWNRATSDKRSKYDQSTRFSLATAYCDCSAIGCRWSYGWWYISRTIK